MKKLFVFAIFYAAGAFITSAHAGSLTLINHYGKTLIFTIDAGQSDEQGLSSKFTLDSYVPVYAREITPDKNKAVCEPFESPIRIDFYDPSSNHKQPNDGYFGAGLSCDGQNNVIVRSYVGRDIAYSINNNYSPNPVITFCTAEEFEQHEGICP